MGPLGDQHILITRYNLIVVPAKPPRGKLESIIASDDLAQGATDIEQYIATDPNSGFRPTLEFTRYDDRKNKVTWRRNLLSGCRTTPRWCAATTRSVFRKVVEGLSDCLRVEVERFGRRNRHRTRRDRAANARRPKTRYATGGGARTILFLKAILPDRMFDRLIGFG